MLLGWMPRLDTPGTQEVQSVHDTYPQTPTYGTVQLANATVLARFREYHWGAPACGIAGQQGYCTEIYLLSDRQSSLIPCPVVSPGSSIRQTHALLPTSCPQRC